MLKKIEIENFKSFEKRIEFDLSDVRGYSFNKECIKNEIVNKAIIYGYNGVGKSNLALGVFDIVSHITDKRFPNYKYVNYLNANSGEKTAKFKYEFKFDDSLVVYEYEKSDNETILDEKLLINNNLFASIKRGDTNEHLLQTTAKGCETLNKNLTNSNISIIKYIKSNAVLQDNRENKIFYNFIDFVDSMLLFRNLDDRFYIGYDQGTKSLTNEIVKNGYLEDFEKFLNDVGIRCKLAKIKDTEGWDINFIFENKKIPFVEVASSGTISLTVFYYWYQRVKRNNNCKFLFIDEFDAFYHHSLSKTVVERLKELYDVQVILSTHNTSIMSNDILRPDCYFFMYEDKITSLAKSTKKELREAHNIEKMYRAGLFG
ncbi:AAA family ATPase [Hydrogenimonas thermophila]|uniref:ATPase AAA-type core domain-containing protein n=1 Tax=Hydrogenimonas thermophila TaxID=223786 RepID=A0A1I5U2E6_9BACT|nr:ATP-binding protein [Hydrogenimonas thermophila]SFP89454.1 hypothetical protein SAMN05216234_15314 [Hydrogenimonas thermophila]